MVGEVSRRGEGTAGVRLHMQRAVPTDLGTVIIQAGKDVLHEVELPSRSVRQYETCPHD